MVAKVVSFCVIVFTVWFAIGPDIYFISLLNIAAGVVFVNVPAYVGLYTSWGKPLAILIGQLASVFMSFYHEFARLNVIQTNPNLVEYRKYGPNLPPPPPPRYVCVRRPSDPHPDVLPALGVARVEYAE